MSEGPRQKFGVIRGGKTHDSERPIQTFPSTEKERSVLLIFQRRIELAGSDTDKVTTIMQELWDFVKGIGWSMTMCQLRQTMMSYLGDSRSEALQQLEMSEIDNQLSALVAIVDMKEFEKQLKGLWREYSQNIAVRTQLEQIIRGRYNHAWVDLIILGLQEGARRGQVRLLARGEDF